MKKNTEKTINIGILRMSSIGDVILATSCIQLLFQLKIPIKITWLGADPSISLIKKTYPGIQVKEIPKKFHLFKLKQFFKELDFVIDLQGSFRSRILCLLYSIVWSKRSYNTSKNYFYRIRLLLSARLKKRQLYPAKKQNSFKLQYQIMVETTFLALKRELQTNLLEHFDPQLAQPRLPINHLLKKSNWLHELQQGRWLAIAPGASFPTKRAPAIIFAELIKKLLTSTKSVHMRICIVGGESDCHAASKLENQIIGPVLNLAGKLELFETAVALKHVNCLLSNDTALAHMAEAVGTPVGVLFGPTCENFGFAPHKKTSKSFSSPLSCRPCSKHGKKSCIYHDKLCFTSLPKSDIVEFLLRFF